MSDDLEHRISVPRFASDSMDALVKILEPFNVHFTAKRQVPDVGLRVYFAAKLRGAYFLLSFLLRAAFLGPHQHCARLLAPPCCIFLVFVCAQFCAVCGVVRFCAVFWSRSHTSSSVFVFVVCVYITLSLFLFYRPPTAQARRC
jgi:hypothetical protein